MTSRFSLVGTLPWLFNSQFSSNSSGYSSTSHVPNQWGYTLGASALILGQVDKIGFRLSGYAGAASSFGSIRRHYYSASITPQYWINHSYGFSANLGVVKPPVGYYKMGITGQLTVLWRASPNLVLTPFVGAAYFPVNSSNPSFQSRNLGVGATYWLDRDWAVFATGSIGTRPAQNTSSGTTLNNFRDSNVSVGVRRSF